MKEDGTNDGKNIKTNSTQEADDEEDCPICQDALPKLSDHFTMLWKY